MLTWNAIRIAPVVLLLATSACLVDEGADDGEARSLLVRDPDANSGDGDGDGDSTSGDGCTLTQGFWKNHESAWPVASLTIGGESYDQAELLDLLHSPVKGDGSLQLVHQLIATMLNVANGASVPADVADAIADADAWMFDNKDADGRLPYDAPVSSDTSSLTDALAGFNEGQSGPGHCDDGGGGGGSGTGGSGTGGSATGGSGTGGSATGGSGTGGSATGGSGTGGTGNTGNVGACPEACTSDTQCGIEQYCHDGCCYTVVF